MRSVYRHTVAALALLCCSQASAVPYPTEDQLRAAIAEVAELLKDERLELEIRDARKQGLTRPLMAAGLNRSTGVCLVFYNTRPEDGLTQFFAAIHEQDLPVWLKAIAVHEVTHCFEQREAYIRKRFDKVLPPDFKRDNVTVQGYLSAVKSGALETWSEALADIASVLYLKQTVPDRWAQFAVRLAGMRYDLAGKWPAHNTSSWLYQIIAADVDKPVDQSLFETAFQLRRQYRPSK